MGSKSSKSQNIEKASSASVANKPVTNRSVPIKPSKDKNKVEEGGVGWVRDLDIILTSSDPLVRQKPIFLLFNEIPGCSTCTRFGQNVLMNETLISAIETYFNPVVVNNRGHSAADQKALSQFEEPMLNNPVVRFLAVDNNGTIRDVIPRRDGVYTAPEIRHRIVQCLQKMKIEFDPRLCDDSCLSRHINFDSSSSLVAMRSEAKEDRGSNQSSLKSIYFSMYCFWQGEGSLDSIALKVPGLVSSASLHGGRFGELVQIVYDENRTDLEKFLTLAVKDTSLSKVVCVDSQQQAAAIKTGWGSKVSLISGGESSSFHVASQSDQKRNYNYSDAVSRYVGKNEKLSETTKMKLNGLAWLHSKGLASVSKDVVQNLLVS